MRGSASFFRLVEKVLFLPSCHLALNTFRLLLGICLLLFESLAEALPFQERIERSGPAHHPAIGLSLAEQPVGIDGDSLLLGQKKSGSRSIYQSPAGFDVLGCQKIAICLCSLNEGHIRRPLSKSGCRDEYKQNPNTFCHP